MKTIIGNSRLISEFAEMAARGKLPHAFMLEGKPGSGKKTIARMLAAMINCQAPENGLPCGKCSACEKIFSSSHSDVHEFIHEDTSLQIKVDVVREIISKASIIPGESEHTIFIIDNAQCMNQSAQNAILKLLEEPPKNVMFFLLTDNKKALLPTIISRTTVKRTEALSHDLMKSFLENEFPSASREDIDCAVLISGGALGAAMESLSGEGLTGVMEKVEAYVNEAGKNTCNEASLGAIFSPFKLTKKDFFVILPMLSLAMHDIAVYIEGGEDFMFYRSLAAVCGAAYGFTENRALRLFDKVEELHGSLYSNPNTVLLGSVLNSAFANKNIK